ncbi:TlpA family protein disulfide reductase [candidate division KSB1 bacterium]|nr:TlpA family protein disulfide reductase [candidate division KSB1 bacterium]
MKTNNHTTKLFLFLLFILFLNTNISFSQETAPDFRLPDLKGKQVSLKSLLGKGPVVIDFWATWCKPCIKYLPKLQKVYDKYKKDGLLVVGINEDGPRNRAKINPFIKSKRINFPILIDANSQIMRRYRIMGLPATVIIAPGGKIFKVHKSYKPGDEKILEKEIKELLSKTAKEES